MPTTIKAGAVTAFVTALKIIGEMKIDNKKQIPVVIAVRPVRPPTPTPELDSTKLVTVLVPIAAPEPTAATKATPKTLSQSHQLEELFQHFLIPHLCLPNRYDCQLQLTYQLYQRNQQTRKKKSQRMH